MTLTSSLLLAEESDAPEPGDISVEDAAALIAADAELIILDVRTAEEFQAAHLENALLLDFLSDDFSKGVADLDREATYLLHCASGGRSSTAQEDLEELGFTRIFHLREGMRGWLAAGMPVISGDAE